MVRCSVGGETVMDLRKYIRKSIDVQRVLNYEYLYYSRFVPEQGRPHLCLIIEECDGSADKPGYQLSITLDQRGRIKEILRHQRMYSAGSSNRKFPVDIEDKAESILEDIVKPGSAINLNDFRILDDRCGTHNVLEQENHPEKLTKARQTIKIWMETAGAEVFVPDYLIALRTCALSSSELDYQVFSAIRKMENDDKKWSLWAYNTILPYIRKKDQLPQGIIRELMHIKALAGDKLKVYGDLNLWRYQLAYNPLACIVDYLYFLE